MIKIYPQKPYKNQKEVKRNKTETEKILLYTTAYIYLFTVFSLFPKHHIMDSLETQLSLKETWRYIKSQP